MYRGHPAHEVEARGANAVTSVPSVRHGIHASGLAESKPFSVRMNG